MCLIYLAMFPHIQRDSVDYDYKLLTPWERILVEKDIKWQQMKRAESIGSCFPLSRLLIVIFYSDPDYGLVHYRKHAQCWLDSPHLYMTHPTSHHPKMATSANPSMFWFIPVVSPDWHSLISNPPTSWFSYLIDLIGYIGWRALDTFGAL